MSPLFDHCNDMPSRDSHQVTEDPGVPVIVLSSESENDNDDESADDVIYSGYELLPTSENSDLPFSQPPHPDEVDDSVEYSLEMHQSEMVCVDSSLSIQQSECEVPVAGSSVSSKKDETEKEITLDSERINVIKSCMSGFQLPPSNCPAWADKISDEQWKDLLQNILGQRRHVDASKPRTVND